MTLCFALLLALGAAAPTGATTPAQPEAAPIARPKVAPTPLPVAAGLGGVLGTLGFVGLGVVAAPLLAAGPGVLVLIAGVPLPGAGAAFMTSANGGSAAQMLGAGVGSTVGGVVLFAAGGATAFALLPQDNSGFGLERALQVGGIAAAAAAAGAFAGAYLGVIVTTDSRTDGEESPATGPGGRTPSP